ncbi:MAG: GMC family oxidoreductase N-terminal domain-containing protein [Chloroflexi bacterium OHK40]
MTGYDYIVIGAGSAGCVLASRLSEDGDRTVLLLEAGGADTRPEIHVPAAWPTLFGSEVDWGYETQPEPMLNGRRIRWPRGRVLGGTSSINGMIYIRGSRHDFDEWAALGNTGWSYTEVLPYFTRSEDQQRGSSSYHGVGGQLPVSDQVAPSPLSLAFVEAAAALGHARNDDFNGEHQEGAGLFQTTTRNGTRQSTAVTFLRRAMGRPNLTVATGALVTRVLLDGGRAVGVEYRAEGVTQQARAACEVILSAGALDSPRLLMLSGVGPASQLQAHGVTVAVDLPGVGENLQDHPQIAVGYQSIHAPPLDPRSNIGEAGLFAHSGVPGGDNRPDLQLHFGPVLFLSQAFMRDEPGFSMVMMLARPQSRGSVRLTSADPAAPAAFQANYLQSERDVAALVAGVRLGRLIAAQAPFDPYRGAELAPGPEIESDEAIRAYIRAACECLWHPVGTCRMGRDRLAVVDPELQVHGLVGLRVVDASVMPTIPTGNTNAATIMIAERAADLIRAAGRR